MAENLLKRLRERLYLIQVTADRTANIEQAVHALRVDLDEMRRANLDGISNDLRRVGTQLTETQALLAETWGVSRSAQSLSGEALSTVNDLRMRDLDLLDRLRLTLGRTEARQLRLSGCRGWRENEFRVYSQFGEDGLIQLLLREVPISNRVFVEFGVEDYREANTRFLLLNDNWAGLVIDGSAENVAALQTDLAYLRHDLKAVATFVTRENIDSILRASDMAGEIGLLSIDIDGNDYWVWEAINEVQPTIVVIEYNYRFGIAEAVVVPYDPAFSKDAAHPSAIYFGASLRALCLLGNRKGYAFVGCSGGGVNAFFVRRDRLPETIREVTVEDGYVAGRHAEMRDAEGVVMKADPRAEQALLLGLPLVQIGAGDLPA